MINIPHHDIVVGEEACESARYTGTKKTVVNGLEIAASKSKIV
jgi:hypothetical protein